MLKSYFFIPANNLKFIEKSNSLNADFIIFDLEDAVLNNELNICFENISLIKPQPNHYIRFSFFENDTKLNENEFQKLLNLGFRNYIIPKYIGVEQAKSIKIFLKRLNLEHDVTFILLIENPMALLKLYESLNKNLINVTGMGLGTHDYCNAMGMKHTTQNLYFARQTILNHAKAFNIDAIDTVSVNIEADEEFYEESLYSFNMGFTGKFLIHPRQLKIINEIEYYSKAEVDEAEKVYDRIMEIKDKKTAVIRIDGKVFEKPHVNRIINIINWSKVYGIK